MPASRGPYRFGDFTFDPDSGELAGIAGTTRLQPQVAALLAVLLEHAGAVVSRAALQARLWPETTVEFDDGLNFCVRQLRLALGDDASAPRYIETLPRRGYRFLPPLVTESPAPPFRARTRRRNGAIATAIALAAIIALLGYNGLRRGRAAGDRIVLAVLPFTADTADSMMAAYRRRLFDQIMAEAAAERMWETLKDPTAGATHVLSGSLTRQGNSVRLFIQLVLVRGHRHLWADSTLDSYAFSGNSTIMADRIEKSVARVLGSTAPGRGKPSSGAQAP
ncbi:MAG TPA: winged helix-turn-helix domain-containing protein [Gemmatimonadaceae bacterium]|nr:winged helix-turn-helix domain-containing protein [Gemmatimonadaceae bacterium]